MKITPKEMDQPDPLMEEFAQARLNMKLYAYKLKAEICAEDPHYKWVPGPKGKESEGTYEIAYGTPNWGTRQKARQDLGGHLGIKPSDKVDHNVSGPVHISIQEQSGCPELPRTGEQPTDDSKPTE